MVQFYRFGEECTANGVSLWIRTESARMFQVGKSYVDLLTLKPEEERAVTLFARGSKTEAVLEEALANAARILLEASPDRASDRTE